MALTPVIARDGNNVSQSMAAFQDPSNVNVAYISTDTSQAYFRGGAVVTPVSGATGTLAVIQGSATKTIRIRRIGLSLQGGTTQSNSLQLQRVSAAGSGGTSNVVTAAKMDPSTPAATAVVTWFSAASRTPGTASGGPLTSVNVLNQAGTSPTFSIVDQMLFPELGSPMGQSIVLRGSSDFLEIQTVAALPASVTMNLFVEWVEDAS
jgi:hypothetical protein